MTSLKQFEDVKTKASDEGHVLREEDLVTQINNLQLQLGSLGTRKKQTEKNS